MLKKILCVILPLTFLYYSLFLYPVFADNNENTGNTLCEVLIETETGTLLKSVNGDLKVPVGTMAKLMTVLLTAEAVESGEISLNEMKKTSSFANSMQGAQIWLMPGEEMTVSDLLKGVIIGNANDASVSLAEAVSGTHDEFVSLMNRRAEELGMKDTSFTNCNGYYNDISQVSTAVDMAILARELSEYKILEEYFTCRLDYLRGEETQLVNTNTLIGAYEGITGFKAGYTDNSGYSVVSGAKRDDNEYIAVVLGCDDKDLSFSEAKKLLSSGFSQYQKIKPVRPKDIPDIIKVKGGILKEAAVHTDEISNIVIPNGTFDTVISKVILPDYIYAPVYSGQIIGEIQYYRNEKLIFSVNITVNEDVEKMSIKKAFGILIKFISSF